MSEPLVLTILPRSNGTYYHWAPVLPSVDFLALKRALDYRRAVGAVFTDWRRIIREVVARGRSCTVRILSDLKTVRYDEATHSYTSEPVCCDWMTIRILSTKGESPCK